MRMIPGFTEDELWRIYHRALEVLETIGLAVEDTAALARLAKVRGFSQSGDRIRIERQVVEAELAARTQRLGLTFPCPYPDEVQRAEIRIGLGTHALNIVDCGAESPRPITTPDVIRGIRLARALNHPALAFSIVGHPHDVPEPLHSVHVQMLSCIHAGRLTYPPVMTETDYAYDLKMQAAMGREPHLTCHMLSPLKLAGNEVACAMRFGDRVKTIGIGNMPQAGVTAPASVPGILIQSLAETAGAYCVFRQLFPQTAIDFGIGAHGTNYRTGSMAYASPGALLVEAGLYQTRGWMGCGWGGGRFMRTHAPIPGPQSCADKAAGGMLGALAGCRSMSAAGYLSLDEVFSPEQLVLDLEIRDLIAQTAAGFAHDEAAFDIAVIGEGAGRGEYMSSADTVARFKAMAWNGTVFQYDMLGTWLASGKPKERKRLTEIVQEALKKDLPPALDREREQNVMKVYAEAQRELGG